MTLTKAAFDEELVEPTTLRTALLEHVLPYVATAENGWYAVVVGDRVGWVSGKYSKIE